MLRVISKQSGQTIVPGVDIFEDGRCVIRTFRGEEFAKVLRRSEVGALFEFFERQGLFSITDESIQGAVDRELRRLITVDATDTCIAVRTSTKRVEICRNNLRGEVRHYSAIGELKTVQRCVDQVYEVAGKVQ